MLERFTQRARRVVVLATEEARSRRHDAIGPEHLLMGILRDGAGLAVAVLRRLGVNPEVLRTEVDRILSEAPAPAIAAAPGFSSELKVVLEAAVEEQWRHHHNYIGTEHLFLGLLDVRSTMSEVLRSAGADLNAAREITLQLLRPGEIQPWPRPGA